MTTAILHHAAFFDHVNPPGHPERVERLQAVFNALATPDFAALDWIQAPACEDTHILRAHPEAYLERIRDAAPRTGFRALDPDTHMSAGTFRAAMHAVGANIRAVDMVMGGWAKNAFCAVRPPGHHAEADRPMGFCIFGNIAIAAKHALDHYGLSRVGVVDFDVHHGNGTQDLVWNDERILFVSTHQMPLYPGSGEVSERGAHRNIVNLPLDPGSDGNVFRQAMRDVALPAIRDHHPEFLFVSAGFDAHRDDPLANLNLTEDDFAWITGKICDIAAEYAEGRVVSTLEGGYDLAALGASVSAHVRVLMERGDD